VIGHFNAEELASYRAGAMSESKAARISVHLSGCARCAGVDSDITGVSLLLASIPIPPMPERLAERLRSAIAAEAAARAGVMRAQADVAVAAGGLESVAPVHTPGRPDLPERSRHRRRRFRMPDWSSPLVLRAMASAAALVLVVGGGLLLARTGGSGSPSSAAKSPSRPTLHRAAAPSSAAIGSEAAAKLHYRHGGQVAYTNLVTTDASFTKANAPAGVRGLVAAYPPMGVGTVPQSATSSPADSTAVSPAPTRANSNPFQIGKLEACISAVAAGRLVQLAAEVRYAGVPVAFIILKPVKGAFDVIVVGQACGASGQDVIARLTVPQR